MRALVAVIALFTVACTYHREVTPWLRTSSYEPSTLGCILSGDSCMPVTKTEHRLGPFWVPIGSGDIVLRFAGGTRVVVHNDIYSKAGLLARIRCRGSLRARGDELLCVELPFDPVFERDPYPDDEVQLTRFDRDGVVIDKRRVPLPVVPGARRAPLARVHVGTYFVGFLGDGLVFSVHAVDERDWGPHPPIYTAYFLGPDDRWRAIGKLQHLANELDYSKGKKARDWNAQYGWNIIGGHASDTHDEPFEIDTTVDGF